MLRTLAWKQAPILALALLICLFVTPGCSTGAHGGAVGSRATAFSLPASDGKTVDIANDIGKRPIVLVFYRGVW